MNLRAERHAAALDVLDSGGSFVLMLRTFRATPTWDRNLQNELYDQLAPAVGVVSIRGDSVLADEEERQQDERLRARCPALWIPDESERGWAEAARDLVGRATHIICEVWTDTPGVSLELSICREAGRAEDTVILIMSPADGGLRRLHTFEGFSRLILVQDLEARCVWEHPSVCGLRLLDRTLPPTFADWNYDDLVRRRDGVPFIIPGLIDLAGEHMLRGDLGSASIYAQSAFNYGVRLAAVDAPFAEVETDGLIRASYILCRRHVELIEFDAADRVIEAGLTLAREHSNLNHYISDLENARADACRAKQSIIDGNLPPMS